MQLASAILRKIQLKCGCAPAQLAARAQCRVVRVGSWWHRQTPGRSLQSGLPIPDAQLSLNALHVLMFMPAVNLPGYSYDITAAGTPSATLCPLNTYGPGMKKQRACVPCPTGFTTNGKLGQTSANTCGEDFPQY